MIKQVELDHGGSYFFRVHQDKVKRLCNGFTSLNEYFNLVFEKCPNEYFLKGPRGSSLRFKLKNLEIKQIKNHEVCTLTEYALNGEHQRNNHDKVEFFLLRNDTKTIAVEIPIWLKPNEIHDYEAIFRSKDVLSGHIDILRIEDGKIWIWDYKPEVLKEKYADTQTFFYALMLSKRTGISLEQFRCGYFDKDYAYIFKPGVGAILKDKQLFNYL